MVRKSQEVNAQHSPVRYFIHDKSATHIAGKPVTPEMRDDGVMMTPYQASHAVASGVISTKRPVDPEDATKASEATDTPKVTSRKAS